jgi:hypothetical protein
MRRAPTAHEEPDRSIVERRRADTVRRMTTLFFLSGRSAGKPGRGTVPAFPPIIEEERK